MPRQHSKYGNTRFLTLAVLLALASGPASALGQIAVVGSTVEEKSAAPGESYMGTIVVRNLTSESQPVRIYQTDYAFFADGTSHFDTPGTIPRSNASWVIPTVGSIVVPPAGETTVAYTVKVPSNNSLSGTYWSALMVEGAVSKPRPTTGREVGIASVMRYAVQVATHLPSAAAGKVAFEHQAFESLKTGSRSFELDVRNTGERGYRPLLWLELYDSTGALTARVEQQRGLLYPGSSLKQKFDLGKVAGGEYKAVVFADIGDEAVFAAQYKVRF